jgi:hypothetical protein
VLALAGTVFLTAVIDVVAVGVGGWLLWTTAGVTIIQGTFLGQLGFLAALIGTSVARSLLKRVARAARPASAGGFASVATTVPVVVAAVAVAAWLCTASYYIGWLALLAVLISLAGTSLDLLIALVRPPARSRGRARIATLAVCLVASVVGLLLTGDLHQGDVTTIAGLLLLTGSAALIGRTVSHVVVGTRQPGTTSR